MSTLPLSLSEALVDRYTLERVLGRGGMATVFLAQDLRHTRQVALKALRPELSQSVGPERFRREIRVAAQLQHPNILPIFDSGDAAGQLWYTMPVVDGESVRDRLQREGPLALHDAISIALQVAEALQHAHERGIIHRDIKPENILLSKERVFVADFGIARPSHQAGVTLTETGITLGTPAYMSPEQIAGSRQLDGRSDLYSLACVLYEMLAGDPPFGGRSAQAVMARHMTDEPPRLRTVRRSVSPGIERVIRRALAKTPADRFSTAARFAAALSTETSRKWLSHRLLHGLFGTGVLAVLVIAAWYWTNSSDGIRPLWAGSNVLEPQQIAVLPFRPLGSDPDLGYVAQGLTKGLIDSLRLVQPLKVVPLGGVAPYRGSTLRRDSIAIELGANTLVEGSVDKVGSQFRVNVWLVQGPSGIAGRSHSLEAARGDLMPMQKELAKAVVRLLREKPVARGSRGEAWIVLQRAQERIDRSDSLRTAGRIADGMHELLMADSLLTTALRLDPEWAAPIIARGQIAYKLSRLHFDSTAGDTTHVNRALILAEAAVKLEPENLDGLELRGTVRYWKWLLRLEADSAKARQLLELARSDLQQATAINPAQAGAWAVLSHLYLNDEHGAAGAAAAARRAYEADPFRVGTDMVVFRLFFTAYDMNRPGDAAYWCHEGSRRFPGNQRFVTCRLYLMTMPTSAPNPTLAWVLADSVRRLAPDTVNVRSARMLVAAVLAKSELKDSARRVAKGARAGPEVDVSGDLLYFEAFVRALLGDRDEMLTLLEKWAKGNPVGRSTLSDTANWWFRDYQADRSYRELSTPPPS